MEQFTKYCNKCNQTLPQESFHRNRTQKDGYHFWCKDCMRIQKRGAKKRNASTLKVLRANVKDMRSSRSRILTAAGLQLLEERLKKKGEVPHAAELLEGLYAACDGVTGFAKRLWDQYEQTEAGSYGRTRVLELVARLTVQNSELGTARKPADAMTDEELDAEAERLAMELLNKHAG